MSLTGLGGRLFSSPRLPEVEAMDLPRPQVGVPDLAAGSSLEKGLDQLERGESVSSDWLFARNWREIWSNVAEITGFGSISAGFWLITPSAGLISGGIGLILVGLSVSSG